LNISYGKGDTLKTWYILVPTSHQYYWSTI
jgi:hypothetical protein